MAQGSAAAALGGSPWQTLLRRRPGSRRSFLSFGFHIPARQSVAGRADRLKNPPASDAVKLVNENGRAQSPLLWTPRSATAFSDALTRIVKEGADAKGEIATIKATVDAELERVNG